MPMCPVHPKRRMWKKPDGTYLCTLKTDGEYCNQTLDSKPLTAAQETKARLERYATPPEAEVEKAPMLIPDDDWVSGAEILGL